MEIKLLVFALATIPFFRYIINSILVPKLIYCPPNMLNTVSTGIDVVNPTSDKKTDRVIIFFHGNATLSDLMVEGCQILADKLSARVYIPEYAGYGYLKHLGFRENVDQLENRVKQIVDKEPNKEFIFIGQSLGSYFATRMLRYVSTDTNLNVSNAKLVLISPFFSLSKLVNNLIYPLVGNLCIQNSNFNTAQHLSKISETIPLLCIHGSKDELIPVEHSQLLADSRKKGSYTIFTNQGHNGFDFNRISEAVEKFTKRYE